MKRETPPWIGQKGVAHVDVASAADLEHAASDALMTVFWLGDRPVGHRFKDGIGRDNIDAGLLRELEEETAERQPSVFASVVICTRDRPDALKVCLESLKHQSFVPREIIVVDNASRDQRTREVAEAAGAVYVREDRPGLDIARNTGARAATSEIIAYTDDDVLLHPRWLEKMVAAFDAPEIGSVTGLVLPAELASEAQLHFETLWSFGQGYRRKDATRASFKDYQGGVYPAWEIGAGASMAFRRSVFDTVGDFDERLDVGQAGCSGDSEYWYRVLSHGLTCRYEPAAVAFHFHRRDMKDLARQIFFYMRGHSAALMVQHERTGIEANRALALYHKPRWYLGRLRRYWRNRTQPQERFLRQEIIGYISGLIFYYRRRRAVNSRAR